MNEKGIQHILIVDDDEQITDIFYKMLTHFGYSVTISTSSREALEEFKRDIDHYNLVITDQAMPDLSGVELAEEIRNIRSGVPVILCSGSDESENVNDENRKFITRSITKPVSMDVLSESVREVLDQSHRYPT